MKVFKPMIFIMLTLLLSCGDDNTENLNQDKSCTQEYCDEIGEKCDSQSGKCVPWCTQNSDCNENEICNDEQQCEIFFPEIKDKNLENCIREELKFPKNKKISFQDLELIEKLECPDRNIKDISTLKHLKNLTKLSLWKNEIQSISALKNLKKLTSLQLGFNNISDITELQNLTNLEKLSLSYNQLENIDTVKNFTKLKWLNIDHNNIKYINFLINNLNLKWVTLEENPIFDANATIKKLKEKKVDVYFNFENKKNKLQNIKLNNKYNYIFKDFKIKRPETYVRTTSNTSYNRLEKFVLESPNQADAGSCLYMANTGAMEIIFNMEKTKENPDFIPQHDQETDISERYLMNADKYASEAIEYTMTDLIRTFNFNKGGLLNKDYPFTVGWIKKDASGRRYQAHEGEDGAYFTAEYNWLDLLPDNWRDLLVKTPETDRTILFLDPDLNQNSIWNVGLMNDDIIERIKYELRTKNAPVIVIYNHYLVWHTDIIVGYDDEAGFEEECPMVKDTIEYFREQGRNSYADKIEKHMQEEGGCSQKGIFYVRDSIYDGDAENGKYNYGGNGYEDFYSKKIIYHSYDWVKYLANHVYSIHRVK